MNIYIKKKKKKKKKASTTGCLSNHYISLLFSNH